jgi:hypothetical protein
MFDISQLIVKPVPKKIEDVKINIKNVDMRDKKLINREDIIERLHKLMSGLSVEPLQIDVDEEEEEDKELTEKEEEKELKEEDKELKEEEDKEDKEDNEDNEDNKYEEKKTKEESKRLTKKQLSIQENIDENAISFSDEIIKENQQSKSVIHKTSGYYMANRRIFIEKINKLLEKYENTETESCESMVNRVQQQIMKDYLNLYSPYRGLLVYHGLGSGKTCTSIAVAEGMKSEKQIIVMTPESLENNFFKELKKCGDEKYRKNQNWVKKMISDKSYAEKLSEIVSLTVEYILEKGIWLGSAKEGKEDKEEGKKFTELTISEQEQVNKQIDVMIRAKYSSINYNKINEETMKKITENGTKNPFENCVVIIDEVHNFVDQIVKDKDLISTRLYDYLMSAQSCKLVFLSGTPIIESPHEIAVIFNMLRGYIKTWTLPVITDKKINKETIMKMFETRSFKLHDYIEYKDNKVIITRNPFGFVNVEDDSSIKLDETGNIKDEEFIKQVIEILNKNGIETPKSASVTKYKALPDNAKEFQEKFIDEDKMINRDVFQRRILGLTSYFKGAPEELLPKYDKNRDFTVIRVPMSEYQTEQYLLALKKDDDEKKNSREACSFVFPEKKDNISWNKEALTTFSPKCLHILENIENEEGLHLVYSESTVEILKQILKHNGFEEFILTKGSGDIWDIMEEKEDVNEDKDKKEVNEDKDKKEDKKKKPKFVLFSTIEDEKEKEIIRNIYNSNWSEVTLNIRDKLEKIAKNNYMGEVIKVFMITGVDAEGISLENTRFVHIVEPQWNAVRIKQVIGRARRICSHRNLPKELQNIKAYLYMSTLLENKQSTDEYIYEYANQRDNINKQFLRAVKETAIDCSLYKTTTTSNQDMVCYEFGKSSSNEFSTVPILEQEKTKTESHKKTEGKKKVIIGGREYLTDKEKNLYDRGTKKMFGKLVREENMWRIE